MLHEADRLAGFEASENWSSFMSCIRVSPARVFLSLLGVIIVLVLMHLAVKGCTRVAACAPFEPLFATRGYLFDLSTESNIPTWYSTMQLAAVALALAVLAGAKRSIGEPALRWWGLVVLFVYLSLDEATDLHGLWIGLTPNVSLHDERTGFDWIIAGAVIVVVIALLYLPWVLALPSATRNLFLAAGATYVGGGMGLEAVGAFVSGGVEYSGASYVLVATAEEALEMLGALIMLYAVLREMRGQTISLRLSDSTDRPC